MSVLHRPKQQQFSARARAFLDLLANPEDRRSVRAKAEVVGFCERHAYRLCSRADFSAAVSARARAFLPKHLSYIYGRLLDDAKNDEIPAIDRHRAAKLLLLVSGEMKPETQINISQTSISLSFPERLQRHVEARRAMLREVSSAVRIEGPSVVVQGGNGHDAEETPAGATDMQSVGNEAGNAD